MPRPDLILKLVEAQRMGNDLRFREIVGAIAAEETAKHHTVFADRLSSLLGEVKPEPRQPLFLTDEEREFLGDIVAEYANEQRGLGERCELASQGPLGPQFKHDFSASEVGRKLRAESQHHAKLADRADNLLDAIVGEGEGNHHED